MRKHSVKSIAPITNDCNLPEGDNFVSSYNDDATLTSTSPAETFDDSIRIPSYSFEFEKREATAGNIAPFEIEVVP